MALPTYVNLIVMNKWVEKIIVDESRFNVIEVCPGLVTVPTEVEAVWVVLQPKDRSKSQSFKFIAVCSYYYAGPKRTPRNVIYDHIAETCNVLASKYGEDLEFILSSDSNKLNLNPILDISPSFRQVVKVPTRLNPSATLDTIITTLSPHYNKPVTKPPLSNDTTNKTGKPSDHLVVLWAPISSNIGHEPRSYKDIIMRPIPDSGLALFGNWLESQSWNTLYKMDDIDLKTQYFHSTLLHKVDEFFPLKTLRVSSDDKPWITRELKKLDRK